MENNEITGAQYMHSPGNRNGEMGFIIISVEDLEEKQQYGGTLRKWHHNMLPWKRMKKIDSYVSNKHGVLIDMMY